MQDWETIKAQIEAKYACEHEAQQLVKFSMINGRFAVVKQCVRCGTTTTSHLKQDGIDIAALPLRDDKLHEQWWQTLQRVRQLAFVEYQKHQNQDFDAIYTAYLRTEHWRQIKRRVLVRDNFRCQNCFKPVNESNSHCHHLHGYGYDGLKAVGHSFAFECVTLCRECHEDYHPHMRANGHV